MGMGLNGLEMLTPTSLRRNLLLGDFFSHPLYPSILLYPFHLPLLPARLQPQQQSSTLSLPKIQFQFKVLNASTWSAWSGYSGMGDLASPNVEDHVRASTNMSLWVSMGTG